MRQGLGGISAADFQRPLVRFAELRLALELLLEERGDDALVDVEELDQAADIGDVLHEDALARILEGLAAKARQRHAEEGHVVAQKRIGEWPRRVVKKVAA